MTAPLQTSERRWAVRIRYWYEGKEIDGSPHLAGRYSFNRHGDNRSSDEHPPTATWATRELARTRARLIRQTRPGWRVTATAVPVMVTTVELDR